MKDLKLPLIAIALIIFLSQVVAAQTTEFTYQGKLADAGMSLTTYDFEFALYDVEVGGVALGTLPRPGVSTANGTFKVNLDFGAATFTGANRWLEVSVKRPADLDFTTLTPRVLITSSPYSIKSIASDTAADSLKLGGVDASEYVTTSSVAGAFVKNDTAQQTASFNVSGTGVIGNNLGIGVAAPQADLKLDVGGNAVFRTANGNINFGTPNSETGMSIMRGIGRADIRFGFGASSGVLKLVAGLTQGPPDNTSGITVDTSGRVGVGVAAPLARFHVSGGSSFFQGDSTPLSPGVGKGIVLGFAGEQGYIAGYDYSAAQPKNLLLNNSGGNVGIGTAAPRDKLDVGGNAVQDRASSGFVKAMVIVSPSGQIVRCYNGVTGNTNPGCGFTVETPGVPEYYINFGFLVDDRFFSVSSGRASAGSGRGCMMANFQISGPNTLQVVNFDDCPISGTSGYGPFTVIVY